MNIRIPKFKTVSTKLRKLPGRNYIIFALGFALVGTVLLFTTQAATGQCSTNGVIGTTTHNINVPETTQYRLWVRMQVPSTSNNGNTNGVRVEVAGNQCFTVTTTSSDAVNQWQWINYNATAASTPHITNTVSAGNNRSAKVMGLRAGVKVDKVLLLKSDNLCIPSNAISTNSLPGDNCLEPLVETKLPDIKIISGSFTTTPTNPVAGDEVSLSITIRNDGEGPTPEGVKHGVTFYINEDEIIAWSDDSTASLAPGATRVLTSNGSYEGKGTWTADEGNFTLKATWDASLRITESGTSKAQIEKNITIAAPVVTPPPDTVKPFVQITSSNNILISKNVEVIQVTATDNVGIKRVELHYANGGLISTTTTVPYNLNFNPRTSPSNGDYQIVARAYDTSDNLAISAPITVRIRHPDINRSGVVDIGDLSLLISSWNQNIPTKETFTPHDLNNDNVIDIKDLNILISRWNQ